MSGYADRSERKIGKSLEMFLKALQRKERKKNFWRTLSLLNCTIKKTLLVFFFSLTAASAKRNKDFMRNDGNFFRAVLEKFGVIFFALKLFIWSGGRGRE